MADDDALDYGSHSETNGTGMTVVFDMEEWKSRAMLVLIGGAIPAIFFFAAGYILWGLVFYGCIALMLLASYGIIRKYPKTRPLFGYVETSREELPAAADMKKWMK